MSYMIKCRDGFSIIELLIIIAAVIILITVGLYVYERQSSSSSTGVKTTNAYIYLLSSKTASQRQTYIDVDFKDSVTSEGCSSAIISSFQGKVDFSYNDTSATLNITQNKRTPKQQPSSGSGVCVGTDEAHPSQDITKRVNLSQQWIENKSATKTITINGEIWKLVLDKSARSLEFSGEEGQRSLQPYLPTDAVEITVPSSCMTNAEMNSYITAHGIEKAEQKYPRIDSAYLKLNPYYNHANRDALVIAGQYVKSLPLNSYNCSPQLVEDPGGNGTGAVALPL